MNGDRVDVTAPSVDAEALRLLETDPAEFFRRTHKPIPTGYRPARAECVCEEPCRYCRCEDTP